MNSVVKPPLRLSLSKVRLATEADVDELSVFAGNSYRQAYCELDDAEEIDAYVAENFSPGRIRELHAQPGSQFLLIESTTEIPELLGYAHTRLAQPNHHQIAQYPMQLVRLYLDQQHKARGLGSELMRAVIAQARAQGCDALWLGVYSLNTAAMAFYQRWGFTQVGLIEFVFAGRSYMDPMLELKLH